MSEVTVQALINPAARDATTGRVLAGTGGNGGRRRGSRAVLGQALIDSLQADFKIHGPKVIAEVRRDDPSAYLTIVARLLPQEIEVGTPGDFSSCSTVEEIVERLLGEMDSPQEALETLDGLREMLAARITELALPAPRARAD